jgi:hypothetical protein
VYILADRSCVAPDIVVFCIINLPYSLGEEFDEASPEVQPLDFAHIRICIGACLGRIYSFEFYYRGEVALSPQLSWEKEQNDTVDPVSHLNYYGEDFVTLPPLFRVEQLYELEYLYNVEGKGEVKFALAGDGNLLMWNHHIAGLTGLAYYFYPVTGFLVGLVVALLIKGINWLKGKALFIHGKFDNHALFTFSSIPRSNLGLS